MYGVNTDFLAKHPSAKMALAFVILDQHGERSFSFHRDNSADLLFSTAQLPNDLFSTGDILHICSNTLTEAAICESTQASILLAKDAGARVSFDVNLRHSLWSGELADIAVVNHFVGQADVLKFSSYKINCLVTDKTSSVIEAYVQGLMHKGTQLLVVTNDGNPIHYYTSTFQTVLAAPKAEVLDTTAGGDAFSRGLLYL